MKRKLLTVSALLLPILGCVLVVGGIVNFYQRLTGTPPLTDGVLWEQAGEGRPILATLIDPNAANGRLGMLGILPGDRLIGISLDGKQFDEVVKASDVQIYLGEAQETGKRRLTYLIERSSGEFYYYIDLDRLTTLRNWTPREVYLNSIGLVYLLVGFFILFKHGGRAPYVSHFTALCLAAFVFHFYNPVGWYTHFDRTVVFLDNAAYIFFAPLFFHFCVLYPVRRRLSGRRWLSVLFYSPAIVLIMVATVLFNYWPEIRVIAPERMIQVALRDPAVSANIISGLYIVNSGYFLLTICGGAVVLSCRFLWIGSAFIRQQLKWVFWGSLIPMTPFTFLFALDYLFGQTGVFSTIGHIRVYPWLLDASLVPLVLVPFTFGKSVARYQLRNTDASPDDPTKKPDGSSRLSQLDNFGDPYRIVGTTLNQRYELSRYAGSGGMGAVYKAFDNQNGKLVAVKVLKPDLVGKNRDYIDLFANEVESARQLKHRNIVEVLDNGVDGEIAYMVMEWLDGSSLEDVIAEGQLTLARMTEVFQQICNAVTYAHDHNIIHLDLKPANILFVQNEFSEDFVKVIDFGLARVISKESGTTVTRFRGTHQYCAPEQFGGRVSKRSDIYSLGATLYYLVSGVVPFGASYIHAKFHNNLELPELPSPTKHRGFNPKIDRVIIKALSKEPAARQQTVRQLFEEFKEAGGDRAC